MRSINFPQSQIDGVSDNVISTEGSIVVIGANGSGKTRLGTWLENNNDSKRVLRVSAQKSLTMPDSVSPVSVERAKSDLMFGFFHQDFTQSAIYKQGNRWGSRPETFLLNDFDKLLVYLFSENYEEVLRYTALQRQSDAKINPPETKLDKIKAIWEYIIPHRELIISSSCINTRSVGAAGEAYNASNMSDGERVIFYLIGECLSAPDSGIIIIDEPEIHLHKSILRKLWDRIEEQRPDCLFVYLTHDLEFASTRTGSTKICLKEFNGSSFRWFPVPLENDIPEEVYLEIVGSRSPILFIEGDSNSYDKEIYSVVYPDFTIKAVGSCSKVIEATKSFSSQKSIHGLDCYGLIDRDYRHSDQITAYENSNIFCLQVAEVENLFLLESVLLAVASQLCEENPQAKVEEIKSWLIAQFEGFKERYALEATSAYIVYTLNSFNGRAADLTTLKDSMNNFISGINVDDIYAEYLTNAEQLIQSKDYPGILAIFNQKGLVTQVGKFFDIKPSAYTKRVRNIIKSDNAELLKAFREALPRI